MEVGDGNMETGMERWGEQKIYRKSGMLISEFE
jgi:hypothetical protein